MEIKKGDLAGLKIEDKKNISEGEGVSAEIRKFKCSRYYAIIEIND